MDSSKIFKFIKKCVLAYFLWGAIAVGLVLLGSLWGYPNNEGIGQTLYTLVVCIVPIYLTKIILFRRKKDNCVPEDIQSDSEYSANSAPAVPVIKSLPDREPPADMPTSKIEKPVESRSTLKPIEDFTNKTYIVAGVQYYTDNLMEIAVPNSNYDMTKKEIIDFGMTDQNIWEYEFYPSKLELQPEPDNPHDPNAIKVLIDDKLVGYIKEGSSKHLLNVIDQDRFMGASCKIGGGKYKRVDEEYDYDRDKTTYSLDKGEKNYSIVLTVKEKKKSQ